VGVDDIDAVERFDLGEIQAESLKRAFELSFGPIGDFGPRFIAAHLQLA
jgi:hypothetical protein